MGAGLSANLLRLAGVISSPAGGRGVTTQRRTGGEEGRNARAACCCAFSPERTGQGEPAASRRCGVPLLSGLERHVGSLAPYWSTRHRCQATSRAAETTGWAQRSRRGFQDRQTASGCAAWAGDACREGCLLVLAVGMIALVEAAQTVQYLLPADEGYSASMRRPSSSGRPEPRTAASLSVRMAGCGSCAMLFAR